jgi:hypothetical protein
MIMKKILCALLVMMPLSSFASETCDQYFKTIDTYLDQIKSSPAMQSQYDAVKTQYDQSKKQLSALPDDQQETACKQGLGAMKMAEEQMKQMKQ